MYTRILAVGVITAVLSATTLTASNARSGCTEAQISAMADFNNAYSGLDQPAVSGSLGYYLTDWLQFGARVTYQSFKDPSYWGWRAVYGVGGYIESEWKRWNCPVTPYLNLGITEFSQNENVTVFTVSPGIKAFLTETIGLSVQANFDFASKEVYNAEIISSTWAEHNTVGDKTSVSCTFGLRFLFF
jgi:hypothetical protein